jgi:hypothetical protein
MNANYQRTKIESTSNNPFRRISGKIEEAIDGIYSAGPVARTSVAIAGLLASGYLIGSLMLSGINNLDEETKCQEMRDQRAYELNVKPFQN